VVVVLGSSRPSIDEQKVAFTIKFLLQFIS